MSLFVRTIKKLNIWSNKLSKSANSEYQLLEPQEIIQRALEAHENIAISFSGAEDVVLIDMAMQIDPAVRVFSLDTGRLHAETYQYLEQIREHYKIEIEFVFPKSSEVEKLVKAKGLFSFYKDGHKECCAVRKVAPLKRKLNTLDAWITGQRRDQSPGTRTSIPVMQQDILFSSEDHSLIKYNPLANWSSADLWSYIRKNQVPFNPLHKRGYVSIGCEPCTQAVLPNQHEREGRWWWEDPKLKECGLHVISQTFKPGE